MRIERYVWKLSTMTVAQSPSAVLPKLDSHSLKLLYWEYSCLKAFYLLGELNIFSLPFLFCSVRSYYNYTDLNCFTFIYYCIYLCACVCVCLCSLETTFTNWFSPSMSPDLVTGTFLFVHSISVWNLFLESFSYTLTYIHV